MAALRIFSYLPNPRIAKATIVARLCGVEVEVRGTRAEDLKDWLWDFDAHPMSEPERASLGHLVVAPKTGFSSILYKTPEFLTAHPFGTVPAAFGPDGRIGIFESNSIMRAVARVGASRRQLYGSDPYTSSRIDSFLDAGLNFGRDTQVYVLALRDGSFTREIHAAASRGLDTYLGGIERALSGGGRYVVGDGLSLADIGFVCELALFHNERNFVGRLVERGLEPLLPAASSAFPKAFGLFSRLCRDEAIAPDLGPYLEELPLR